MENMDPATGSSRASTRIGSTGGGGTEHAGTGTGVGEEVLGVPPHYDVVNEGDQTPDLPPTPSEGVVGVGDGEGHADAEVAGAGNGNEVENRREGV